jgi:hypothetical protein
VWLLVGVTQQASDTYSDSYKVNPICSYTGVRSKAGVDKTSTRKRTPPRAITPEQGALYL